MGRSSIASSIYIYRLTVALPFSMENRVNSIASRRILWNVSFLTKSLLIFYGGFIYGGFNYLSICTLISSYFVIFVVCLLFLTGRGGGRGAQGPADRMRCSSSSTFATVCRIHTGGIRKGGGRGEGNSPAAARPCPRTALRWARSPPCRATSSKENQWNENQWGKVMYLHGQTDGGNNLPLWKFSAIRSQKEPRSRLRVFVTYNECATLHFTYHH